MRAAAVVEDRFRVLFDAQFDFVCRSLGRLGVRDADLADVAQDLFVTVHREFAEIEETRSPRGWLFAHARRFAANYRRLGWHRGRPLDDDLPRSSPRLAGRLDARTKVTRALAALDDDKATVLILHDLEGLSAPEIADEIGVPLNTVYSRIRLARGAFRLALEGLEVAE